MTSDPFQPLRRATLTRERAEYEWCREVEQLRALGFSLRAIAEVAGVSHDTVWKMTR